MCQCAVNCCIMIATCRSVALTPVSELDNYKLSNKSKKTPKNCTSGNLSLAQAACCWLYFCITIHFVVSFLWFAHHPRQNIVSILKIRGPLGRQQSGQQIIADWTALVLVTHHTQFVVVHQIMSASGTLYSHECFGYVVFSASCAHTRMITRCFFEVFFVPGTRHIFWRASVDIPGVGFRFWHKSSGWRVLFSNLYGNLELMRCRSAIIVFWGGPMSHAVMMSHWVPLEGSKFQPSAGFCILFPLVEFVVPRNPWRMLVPFLYWKGLHYYIRCTSLVIPADPGGFGLWHKP